MKIAKEPISMETPLATMTIRTLATLLRTPPTPPRWTRRCRPVYATWCEVLTFSYPARGQGATHALCTMSTDHTLEEVGKQFDVTRERIRQIESKAVRKLKHSPPAPIACAVSSTFALRPRARPGRCTAHPSDINRFAPTANDGLNTFENRMTSSTEPNPSQENPGHQP